MTEHQGIVSTTIRLDPPLDARVATQLRTEGGLSVELDNDQQVRLDPNDRRSAGFAQVLDQLRSQGLPVYVEVDPQTSAITRLLIPHVAHVTRVGRSGGMLDVELDRSHARHTLPVGHPDTAEFERVLRTAQTSASPVILTEDENHQLLDVRLFRGLQA